MTIGLKLSIAILILFALAACKKAEDKKDLPDFGPIGPVIVLAPQIEQLYREYEKEPIGAFFFVSRDGQQGTYFHCINTPCEDVTEMEFRERCFAAGIRDCLTYARGREILFRANPQHSFKAEGEKR